MSDEAARNRDEDAAAGAPSDPAQARRLDALARRAMPLCEARIAHFTKKWSGCLKEEELRSAALEGLAGCLRSFDEARDATFEGYVVAWVDGLMRRRLRTLDRERRIAHALGFAGAVLRAGYRDDTVFETEQRPELRGALKKKARVLAAVAFAAAVGERLRMAAEDQVALNEEHARERAVLREALEKLPVDERAVIEAVYGDELTYEEAARELGISEPTVSRRLKRALPKLEAMLRARRVTSAPEPRDWPGHPPVLRGLRGLEGEGKDGGKKKR